jgi:hypothetical protein
MQGEGNGANGIVGKVVGSVEEEGTVRDKPEMSRIACPTEDQVNKGRICWVQELYYLSLLA